jgi:hypothetical protein
VAYDEDSLAKTPMAFTFGSGKTISGFDEPAPLREAFVRAAYTFLSVLGFLIIALATLLPWIVLAALGVWAYRRWRPRWSFGEPRIPDGRSRTRERHPGSTRSAREERLAFRMT